MQICNFGMRIVRTDDLDKKGYTVKYLICLTFSGDFYSLPAKKSPSTALLIGPTVPNMEPVLIIGCRSFPLNVYLPLDIDLIRFVVV